MEFIIKNTSEKIRTIQLLRQALNTGLKEAKAMTEGEQFHVPEDNHEAELYLDILATDAEVVTDKPFVKWQIEKAIDDADNMIYQLTQRIQQAKKILPTMTDSEV